jgi:RNA polymerase sigma factor (TIGR02999 family)
MRGAVEPDVFHWWPMSEVTQILSAIEQGDPHAAEQLLPLVYDELRRLAAEKMAQEKPGQTLQATALVHEAYLRLVDVDKPQHWNNRFHFFAAAAEAMRRILVENVRRKKRLKRGGGRQHCDLRDDDWVAPPPDDRLLALDEALGQLATAHPELAELVKLRYFAQMTVEQTAELLGLSPRTIKRNWVYARAWLRRAMLGEGGSQPLAMKEPPRFGTSIPSARRFRRLRSIPGPQKTTMY